MIKFTKDEKIVSIFILAMLFLGMAILYYKRLNPPLYQIIEFSEEKIEESEKIAINEATKEELIKVKGIGPVLARRIISYREKFGPFKNKEEIKNVKGIGKEIFEKIKTQIKLE